MLEKNSSREEQTRQHITGLTRENKKKCAQEETTGNKTERTGVQTPIHGQKTPSASSNA